MQIGFLGEICMVLREKSRECHNHKPQPFPDTKRKRKQTTPHFPPPPPTPNPQKKKKSAKLIFWADRETNISNFSSDDEFAQKVVVFNQYSSTLVYGQTNNFNDGSDTSVHL